MRKGFDGGQYQPLSQDKIGRIHESALRVLEDVGVTVDLPEALEVFSQAGTKVDVDGKRVRIPAKIVEKSLRSAPSELLLCGREPENDLLLQGSRVYMGTGGAAPKVIDPDTGEARPGSLRDIVQLARLADGLGNIDFFIRPCTAQDVPQEQLAVNEFYAAISNTSKHVMGAGYTVEGARQVMDMATLVCGGGDKLAERPFISFTTAWMVSPLTFHPETTRALVEIVSRGIPVALSSTPMAGVTSPITMAGTLTQLHAEELSGLVFCQLVNPGAPVLYGGIPGMADMHSLSFRAGGVEFGLMNAAISQLANYMHIPNYCSAGTTEAKTPSLQAIYEKTFSICQCALAGSNYVHHAAGVLESILAVDYGQFVIDSEIIGMAMKMIQGIEVDEDRLALDQIKEVGPGGNFLTLEHTMEHLRSEYLAPGLLPREERTATETLREDRHIDALDAARERAKEIIGNSSPPGIPGEIDARIRERFQIQCP